MEIPLFPLPNLVLFPNIVVPLHIFEDRYRLMINSCISGDEPFGIVLLQSGAEEESDETIHRVGVTARVLEVDRLEDGRMNVLCEGESRFRVLRFTQQTPYWKGSVEFFEDEEGAGDSEILYEQVAELYRKAGELGGKVSGSERSEVVLPDSAVELSFMISYVLDLDAHDKQQLLEMTSTAGRLRSLVTHLDATIKKLEQQLAYKVLVSKVRGNGDLGKPHAEK